MAQAVRRSPPTAGLPSSRHGHSMWVSWWTKRGLGRFFFWVSPVFPYPKFHPTISPHSSHPFSFISSALVMVRQAWSVGTLAIHWSRISGLHRISSLDPTLCWTRVEDIYFILKTHIPELTQLNSNFACSPFSPWDTLFAVKEQTHTKNKLKENLQCILLNSFFFKLEVFLLQNIVVIQGKVTKSKCWKLVVIFSNISLLFICDSMVCNQHVI